MVLARKESAYTDEQVKRERQPQIHKKRQRSYRFEKVIITIIIAIIFACSISILTRFTSITEARYNVSNLEKRLESLEAEKAKLKVEVEKVSKSGWIESEAKTRLQMDYPTADQIISINVNPAKVAMLTNRINKSDYNNSIKSKNSKSPYRFFKKLISCIRI